MNYLKTVVIVFFCSIFSSTTLAQKHPSLMLTEAQLPEIRTGVQQYPLLQTSYEALKAEAELALKSPLNVPVPTDGGGGITHEQHKRNYINILNCGVAYQISQDKKYATYVRDILLNYASQYQKWPLHPKRKPNHPAGKIFWQGLNDCVWQVYVIQGYDLVYDALTAKEREQIEQNLFMPILKFLTVDSYETFNKIHNHGTWNVAAVGMTGYVLNQPDYVEMAIKGSKKDSKTGYLAQINQLFSPDGYYMEGPYYQRYALLPFILFAKAIHNYQPQLNIFAYRDRLLAKAINTSLQLTYTNGVLFPFNDAIKDKTYESIELVYGLNLAYADIKEENHLLDIAQKQKKVIVSDAGLKVAKAIAAGKTEPFKYQSQWIRDGGNGNEGGVGVLRAGDHKDQQALVFKAASQGMGHGHFDRLNILYYDNNAEVFIDYGAARFINIESKRGGHYLPENTSWAKQTVAHNTLVVDEISHYQAKEELGEKQHPELLYFSNQPQLQVVSAKETHAYADVDLYRTTALVKLPELHKALLIDVYRANSANNHQYDLPFWYNGHLVNSSFKINAITDNLRALGKANGYQHIWKTAENTLDTQGGFITILNNERFYTTHFTSGEALVVKQMAIGANDPEMSLFPGKGFMLSQAAAKNQTFVSVTEAHGGVDPINETITAAGSGISNLSLISSDDKQTQISFKLKGKTYNYTINYQDKDNYIIIK
ncbi:alginate lyase family protein [Pedobacter aquae]|uniref:Alginate lyase family protein n=1 Tax=Pedobacter aquae TaxID=2605747 RepID=A0A5C0VGT3_9SPHI|nr:heparinase II/III family protein [Pedobacter aquae]QEK50400.1 alginate lyase family protein [Pedobacter aquae]